ncbi:MAG: LysR family transcriptional regulator [Candidatus Binatia bacterium]
MTLHQLRIFSSIAKYLNVTRASAELHISQPSVSQQVKLLQEEYGATFYRKAPQGIRLTDEGRLFLKEIEPILVQFDQLKKKCGGRVKEHSLAIGGSRSPSASFLPQVASIFKRDYPDAKLTLRTDNSDVLEQMVMGSEVEIAVITDSSASSQLIYEPCRQEELVFISPPQHPLVRRKNVSVGDLAGVPLVVFKKGRLRSFGNILSQIEKQGFNLNVVMYCDSSDALKSAVKEGIGVGLIYRDLALGEIERKDFKVIRFPGLVMRSASYIIYPKDKPLSAHAKRFLALLRQQIEPNRPVNGAAPTEQTLASSAACQLDASKARSTRDFAKPIL